MKHIARSLTSYSPQRGSKGKDQLTLPSLCYIYIKMRKYTSHTCINESCFQFFQFLNEINSEAVNIFRWNTWVFASTLPRAAVLSLNVEFSLLLLEKTSITTLLTVLHRTNFPWFKDLVMSSLILFPLISLLTFLLYLQNYANNP